ncbi:major facilitator superfamily domain-containing protein [Pavlovales sp. CCMP2436]|nr:major facilitator superfamily domain-containing protein [Pavlovales sp. CCMP2436]
MNNLSSAERVAPRTLLAALLFVAVMMNQVSRVMIPSLLSTIKEDSSFGSAADGSLALAGALPTMLPITSMTCLIGKLALGTVTDRVGGSTILILVFALFVASTAGLIATKSVTVFGLMWVLNSLAYTATWGAATQVIHAAFPKEAWPTQLSSIASAGRLGAAVGAIIYGSLLAEGLTWRAVFAVPLVVQVGLVVLCLWQHATVRRMQALSTSEDEAATSAPAKASAPADASGGSATSPLLVMMSLDFWLMMAAKCTLFVFTQWFMNFVGLYLRSAFHFSAAASTNAISIANAGQMVALLVGGKYYKVLRPEQQLQAVTAMLAVTAVVPALLCLRESIPGVSVAVLPLLFVWGLAFAVPFYLPIGTYALECGGKKHSTLFTNLLDAGGFTVSSVWNRYAAAQSRINDWDAVIFSLAVLGSIAFFALPLAMYRRLPRAKRD